LHLSRPALVILRPLADQRAKVEMLRISPLEFTTTGRKLTTFQRLKEQIDTLMAADFGATPDGWVLHDLRRTAATLMARLKVSPVVVEKILNHAKGETIGGPVGEIYNRYDYADECAEALDRLGEFVVGLASPRVVPLRRA
jgi:hypothetical protein